MNIVRYNYNNYTTFNAKFLHSEDLQKVVDYSIENGKFLKLDEARQRLETKQLRTRLMLEIGEEKCRPTVIISRYDPRRTILAPIHPDKDYTLNKCVKFISLKEKNPLEFAYRLILKMSANVPNNKIYDYAISKKTYKRYFTYVIN